MKTTYYLMPSNSGYILFRDLFGQPVPTIAFAKSYAEFAGAELVVVDENGKPLYTVH